MQRSFSLRFLLLLALCATAGNSGYTHPARAAESEPASVTIDKIEAGFNGYYKVGEWTPLYATVSSPEPIQVELTVEVPDADADTTLLTTAPVKLDADQPARIESRFMTGRSNGSLTVLIKSEGKVLASRTLRASDQSGQFRPGLLQMQQLWVTVGEPGAADEPVTDEQESQAGDSDPHRRVVTDVQAESLPSNWQSYGSVDVLIAATGTVSESEKSFLELITPAQSAALNLWVRCGGHLTVSLGQKVASYLECELAEWIPVPILKQASARQLREVEAIAGGTDPLPDFQQVPTAVIGEEVEGEIVRRSLNGPVLVNVPYGFGRVSILNVDLNLPPLSQWSGTGALIEQIVVGRTRDSGRQSDQNSEQLSSSGITDLSSQLFAFHQNIEEVGRINIWSVMVFLVLYIALIGPVDYWVVHKLLKRPELTWITFPLLVSIASGLSIWTSQSIKGRSLQLKQLSLIDLDTSSGQMQGRTWLGLFSPQNAAYTLSASPDVKTPETTPGNLTLSWSAMAEDAIGGLNRQGGLHLTDRSYRYADDCMVLEDVPIGHWSAKSFEARWQRESADLVTNELTSPGPGRLIGVFAHKLPVPLENCLLAFGGSVYRMEKLAPHQQWTVSPLKSRNLQSLLTGTTSRQLETTQRFVDEREDYDPNETDPEVLARMLTFHDAAGGRSYTGMAHLVVPELDYTRQMRLGRAVLFARVNLPGTEVRVNDAVPEETERHTFIRIVLPVQKSDNSGGIQSLPNTRKFRIPE